MIGPLLKDLSAYLSQPYLSRIPKKIDRPFLLLFNLVVICIFAGITAGVFSGILIRSGLIPNPGPNVLDEQKISQMAFLFAAVVLAPVMEELIFRAQLRRFSGGILFISFICGALLSALLKTSWAFLISPLIFILLFTVYRFTLAGSLSRKHLFWERIFPWYFHFTALCFALVHLSNFQKGISLLPLGILYTFPQLVIGLVLGYTRVNYGLKYSIALHALYNLSLTLLMLSKLKS